MTAPAEPAATRERSADGLLRIALLSVHILFLEMLLVRWIGTEIRVFAYLQNGVLVAAFLGLGLGCRNARRRVLLLPTVLALLLIAFFIRDPLGWRIGERLSQGLVPFMDSAIFGGERWDMGTRALTVSLTAAATLALLLAVAYGFVPLGQCLGRWMDEHARPVAAYSANIVGSLVGIAVFDALTIGQVPPVVWLALAALGFLPLTRFAEERRGYRLASVIGILALPLLAWNPGATTETWSPYQKLSLSPLFAPVAVDGVAPQCGWRIGVNNTLFQAMVEIDPGRMAESPAIYPGDTRTYPYRLPYEIVKPHDRVLIVGAGSGNDVAAALVAGASHVRAIEIDPAIVAWGKRLHPDKPYDDPRVEITIDDARAVFRQPAEPFDVAWFGLLDSHTTPSAYANIRLDHFVYTLESFRDVKRLLKPTGVVVLFFEPVREWVGDRMAVLLGETFHTAPITIDLHSTNPCAGYGGFLFIGGPEEALARVRQEIERDPVIRAAVSRSYPWKLEAEPTTDDWPYLYLEHPGVPMYHKIVAGLALLLGLLLRRRLFRPGEEMSPLFLLLGAGFMLLEVSGVSRAAMLYGTTWTVNAYVVGAMLVMILLANLTVARLNPDPSGWPSLGLVVSLAALALAPMTHIAGLPLALRILAGGAFLSLPVYFSGLVFVGAWASSPRRDLALGSNMLGSLVGGVLSLLSMAIGFRALSLLTLAVYLAALLLLRRGTAKTGNAAASTG